MSAHPSKTRCPWCEKTPLYQQYHDTEWGVPLHDDTKLFEFLTLESFQAGLSWLTILNKRENFRRAFAEFDPAKVARFTAADQERLMADSGIVRNRAKIAATITNAQAFLAIQASHGSFDAYIWGFVDGTPIVNKPQQLGDIPGQTALAVTISKDLKKRGFKFMGPTVVYAHMQATGMVNDHLADCFRQQELSPCR